MTKSAVCKRLCVVGSTGMVGSAILEAAVDRADVRIIGITRREVPLPRGARMEMLLCDPQGWPDAIAASNAQVLICALGTTMRNVQGDKEAFRAVDFDLVLASGRAARDAGIDHMIVISSVGADDTSSKFYLKTKGDMETGLRKLGLRRLDILRPGLLVGKRKETRLLERIAIWLAPVLNLFLHGKRRKYRCIKASRIAEVVFALAHERPGGRFVHEFDAMNYVIKRAGDYSEIDRAA
ncbi:MAG: NAD(P)H-binding protein [Sphingomonadaceae bacterium]|nr:NAD(P)H-binding protein [Sphingomonadaceae bacterium]